MTWRFPCIVIILPIAFPSMATISLISYVLFLCPFTVYSLPIKPDPITPLINSPLLGYFSSYWNKASPLHDLDSLIKISGSTLAYFMTYHSPLLTICFATGLISVPQTEAARTCTHQPLALCGCHGRLLYWILSCLFLMLFASLL